MRRLLRFTNIFVALALIAASARAGAPLPSLTFYGMLVDEFGWPYETNVKVELQSAGVPIFTRSLAPARGRDYNFLVRIPYDSGTTGDSYSQSAVSPNQNVALKISSIVTGSVLINTNLVIALYPGSVVNINLSAGTDSVGDGLPDELRRWIWQNTGMGGAFDPHNVRANDDSDFDGVSNIDEYRAGTDPANFEDVLSVEVAPSGVPNVGKLTFYTVPGKTYQISAGDLMPDSLWSITAFANTPDGAATYTDFIGTGHYVSLFVPTTGHPTFYRVFVQGRRGTAIVP